MIILEFHSFYTWYVAYAIILLDDQKAFDKSDGCMSEADSMHDFLSLGIQR